MPLTNRNAQEVIIYYSTTQGLPPSQESTTYDAAGDRIQTVGLIDINAEQTLLEDERTMGNLTESPGPKVLGLRKSSVTLGVYLTGTNATTAPGSQVSETALSRLLKHVLGGQSRGNATTAKVGGPHSTTSVSVTSTTNLAEGQVIGIVDADDGSAIVHVRRVVALAGDLVTFDQALPFTPADGDKIVGAITHYFDESVLAASDGGAGRTSCIFVRQGHAATYGIVEYRGAKGAGKLSGFGPGESPRLEVEFQACSHRTPADTGSTGVSAISSTPAFSGTAHGIAPLVSGLEIDLGVEVVPVDAATQDSDEMAGIAGYTCRAVRPTFTFAVTPHATELLADLQAGAYKAVRLEIQHTEGKTIAIGMPRCSLDMAPKVGANGEVLATMVTLRGHHDTIDTTQLAKSPIYVGIL
jgi:hypothetical protein